MERGTLTKDPLVGAEVQEDVGMIRACLYLRVGRWMGWVSGVMGWVGGVLGWVDALLGWVGGVMGWVGEVLG